MFTGRRANLVIGFEWIILSSDISAKASFYNVYIGWTQFPSDELVTVGLNDSGPSIRAMLAYSFSCKKRLYESC